MLVLRLQRTGRTNLATYRIVVAEKARPVKGKFQEIIGHYLPTQKDSPMTVDKERVDFWVKRGATPSNTLARLLKKQGVAGMDKFIVRYAKQRPKNAPPEEATPAPTPAAAPVAEAAPASAEATAGEPAPVVEEKAPEAEAPAAEQKPAEPEVAAETPATEGDKA